jgi:hypothetical protein
MMGLSHKDPGISSLKFILLRLVDALQKVFNTSGNQQGAPAFWGLTSFSNTAFVYNNYS